MRKGGKKAFGDLPRSGMWSVGARIGFRQSNSCFGGRLAFNHPSPSPCDLLKTQHRYSSISLLGLFHALWSHPRPPGRTVLKCRPQELRERTSQNQEPRQTMGWTMDLYCRALRRVDLWAQRSQCQEAMEHSSEWSLGNPRSMASSPKAYTHVPAV